MKPSGSNIRSQYISDSMEIENKGKGNKSTKKRKSEAPTDENDESVILYDLWELCTPWTEEEVVSIFWCFLLILIFQLGPRGNLVEFYSRNNPLSLQNHLECF